MSARLFTADTHLGHAYMASLRGFSSVEEHDETIIANWNREVKPRDSVFLAGDAAMGIRKNTLPLFSRMNGTKHLITGNHDDCWPGHINSWTKRGEYEKVFAAIQQFLRIVIDGHTVLISHFPYTADHTDPPRHLQYRLRDEGRWLLHGHTHSYLRITSPREIHVGMDAWDLTPVPEYKIVTMIRAQLTREKEERQERGHAIPVPPSDSQGAPAASDSAAFPARADLGEAIPESGTAGTPRHFR